MSNDNSSTNQFEITDNNLADLQNAAVQYADLDPDARLKFAADGAQQFAMLTFMLNEEGVRDMVNSGREFATRLKEFIPEQFKQLENGSELDLLYALFGTAMETLSIRSMQLEVLRLTMQINDEVQKTVITEEGQ